MCAAAEVSLYLEFVARAMLSGIALYFVLFALIVYCQRARWRRGQQRGKRRGKRIHFYPTTMMIGLALQTLQVFAHPEIDHTIQQRYADAAEEEDEADPDDPRKALEAQLIQLADRLVAVRGQLRAAEAADRLPCTWVASCQ